MNRLRIIGLVLLAALLVWLAARTFMSEAPQPTPPPAPVREAFHPTKPLHIDVQLASTDESNIPQPRWLARELRYLLARGKMNVAALDGGSPDASNRSSMPYTLRISLKDDATRADLALVAPDGITDKHATIELSKESQLATIQRFARHLPQFLDAPTGAADWLGTVGTDDAAAYDAFLRAGDELFAPDATGFTAPPSQVEGALKLERLETLSRRHRQFARARALLSLAYLSVGGDDQASLTKLAETAAERALTIDAELADARAALGIVRLRRMEWVAAQEHFEAARKLDPSSLPALEGLGCLLMDVGHVRAALGVATLAANLQPGNRGSRKCATYATIASGAKPNIPGTPSPEVARIHAAMALLAGDRDSAARLLRTIDSSSDELTRAIIDASGSKKSIPQALQVVTRSADEEAIDAEAEILFGTALRRPDFVFNRMLRLAKQDEAAPLRVLWLPQTDFLRKHRRFKEVVGAATLTTYWQDHGLPDVCETEPKVHGCAVKAK